MISLGKFTRSDSYNELCMWYADDDDAVDPQLAVYTQVPPTSEPRSKTVTARFSRRSSRAATRPAAPAPTTATSRHPGVEDALDAWVTILAPLPYAPDARPSPLLAPWRDAMTSIGSIFSFPIAISSRVPDRSTKTKVTLRAPSSEETREATPISCGTNEGGDERSFSGRGTERSPQDGSRRGGTLGEARQEGQRGPSRAKEERAHLRGHQREGSGEEAGASGGGKS